MLGQACAHCPIFPTAASRRSLGRVSVPVWPITLSGRLPIVDLVGRYLTNYLMGRELTLYRIPPLTPSSCDVVVLCGISTCFQVLSPCRGQIAHALLTRPPIEQQPKSLSPLDLHVLGTPPAFVLSQNQTLMFNSFPRRGSLKPLRRLSQITDCLFALVLSNVVSRCIVFKDRLLFRSRPSALRAFGPLAGSSYIIPHLTRSCQYLFELFLGFF